MNTADIYDKFRRWANSHEEYGIIPCDSALDELKDILGNNVDDGDTVISSCRGMVVIDLAGRIYFNGMHVGWLNKAQSSFDLKVFADALGAEYPLFTDNFLSITEPKD